ncbi:hypothetical protein [Entomobacter blattae]|uniref:Uncharacterized protein n=1 Tax=Entomobacter blattae TaxID=2762277 RepID=A0A7H1NTH7_9PROT|nr:hypothetical protein [Entomobacter blattae]QNT79087.1 hypothetical protein JGUZn3_18730 [Entomobacter blattae]
MSLSDFISKIDFWVLDRLFQPIADWLPERPSAIDVGMNFQLGALVFSAASLIAMVALMLGNFGGVIFNIIVWFYWVAFYVGLVRMRGLIRQGFMNPFREMLKGIRPFSFLFIILSVWQSLSVPSLLFLVAWFNALSNLVFFLGVYLVSCEVRPKKQKQKVPFGVLEKATR